MKKLISIILVVSIVFCMSSVAFADYDDEVAACAGETMLMDKSEDNGGYVTYSSNADGSYSIHQYYDGVKYETYTVIPGSGFYTKDALSNEATTSESEVIITDSSLYAIHMNSVNSLTSEVQPLSYTISYSYWGSARYEAEYAPWEPIMVVDCYKDKIINPETDFLLSDHYSDLAELISAIASAILTSFIPPIPIAKGIAEAFIATQIFRIINGAIKAIFDNFTDVTARVEELYIKAQPGSGSEKDGDTVYYESYKATVTASNVGMNGKVLTNGWQESDWGNLTFGRLLFYDVFGVEVHPTEWIR